jgi:hypothetical protein
MLVRWSNQEDYAYWTPTATNTAGDQRLVVGTKITAAISTRDETFISTDEAVYGMNFVGPPFTFAFRLLATNCGAIGKNVMGNVDGDVYWMTNETFFVYNGAVREIPCPVKHYVFDRMQKNYSDKFFCALNKDFDEVTWFYVIITEITLGQLEQWTELSGWMHSVSVKSRLLTTKTDIFTIMKLALTQTVQR